MAAATKVLSVLLLLFALTNSSEVQQLDDPAGDAIQKAIESRGKGDTIKDAKDAIKAVSEGTDPVKNAEIEQVKKQAEMAGEAAAEAKDALAQKTEEKAKVQVQALEEEAKKAKESAKQEEEAAEEKAKVAKEADEKELEQAKAEAKKAIDGAVDKSLNAAQTSYDVADKAAAAAQQDMTRAKKELKQAEAATTTVDQAKAHAEKVHEVAKQTIVPPEVKVTADMWAKKVGELKKEAFSAHIDSARAAQAELDAQKAVHKYEEKLREKKEEVSEEKAAVSEKQQLMQEAQSLRNNANAKAKFSVDGDSVKKQLAKNAEEEDEQEKNAELELAAARKKEEATESAVAAMEHGNELSHLQKNLIEAQKKLDAADRIARNAEDDFLAAHDHYKQAADEQKRKDERAKVAAEIRHKKAISGHKLAELKLF